MQAIFEKKYKVSARDTDLHGRCRPSAILEFLQDLATDHAIDLEVGRDVMMAKYGVFWMMARLELRLNQPVLFEQEITVRTWHRGAKSAAVIRDFDLIVDGRPVGEAITSWVMASLQDRRICRPSQVGEFVNSARPEITKTDKPEKISMPESLVRWGRWRVRYSDTDINGHMNNVHYADVACDAMGYGQKKNQYVSRMSINYLHECFMGEDMLVFQGEDGGRYFVRGTDDAGVNRFDMALTLSQM